MLCYFGLCVLVYASAAHAERVRYVIDGDTVVLESGEKVRLIGIDAPEIDHTKYGKIGEPQGPEAALFLRELVENKDVRLEAGSEPVDKYGRRLAYLFLEDGTFVNRKMVETGFAETYRRFDFVYKKEFLKLEKDARGKHLGMWIDKPEDWRNQFIHWLSMRKPKRKAVSFSTDN